ncbi:Protein naked cuticle 1 [Desmophyllum pertusum]|uniref:Protein naked cuticle homolog n=1 Tax=Desmophyllum pertusum TaxID=174260 RepID=A0A9W9ZIX9_9CNID|nr:Protein naked cuticle 1 [Desmophyllum pertusum]
MGKKYSKQAWISREGPEGDCVVENDSTNLTLNLTEESKEKGSCTADFTYKGYPVNVLQDGPCVSEKEFCKKYAYYDYPIEVVELPDEPDGKKFEVFFEREGQVEASTQTTRPVTALSECGQSVKSTGSDRQEWSYTLYDFEGQGHVTRDDLKNLVKSIYEVLGKSMSRPKSMQKDPVKKLCVRLSLSKERSRDVTDIARRECLLTTNGFQEHPRKSKAKRYVAVEREGSMTVNPPSTDYLSQVRPQNSLCEPTQPENHGSSGVHHRRSSSCRRCEQRQPIEKDCLKSETRKTFNPVDSKGMYHYPRECKLDLVSVTHQHPTVMKWPE